MDSMNLRKAVRLNCMECNGEVKGGKKYDCLGKECYLYPWKEGKGVYEVPENIPQEHKDYLKKHGTGVQKSRELSIEDKQKVTERLRKARENKQSNKEEVNE